MRAVLTTAFFFALPCWLAPGLFAQEFKPVDNPGRIASRKVPDPGPDAVMCPSCRGEPWLLDDKGQPVLNWKGGRIEACGSCGICGGAGKIPKVREWELYSRAFSGQADANEVRIVKLQGERKLAEARGDQDRVGKLDAEIQKLTKENGALRESVAKLQSPEEAMKAAEEDVRKAEAALELARKRLEATKATLEKAKPPEGKDGKPDKVEMK
jgi:cell division protein FtsB